MVEVYWACFIGGALFAIVTIIFGDLLGHMFDGMFDGIFHAVSGHHLDIFSPMVTVGGITIFGGAGIMLTKYTPFQTVAVILLSLFIAFIVSVLVYFVYVRPMKNAENSIGFSLADLEGKLGEVILRIGAGNTNQIAGSYDNTEISAGTKVVVGAVRDRILYVFKYEE
ncbi:MAG: protease [Thermincola sp.]|jgi:membrane protein implicated in regulation of membrane protease activity|nr:protease [Thermincola sp.]MDT3702029.1 protease [Thermincola sp.]